MAKSSCWPSVSQVYLPVVHDLSNYVSKHGSNIIQIQRKDSHEELTVTFKPLGGKTLQKGSKDGENRDPFIVFYSGDCNVTNWLAYNPLTSAINLRCQRLSH